MNSQSKHKHVGSTAQIRSSEEPSLAQVEERGGAGLLASMLRGHAPCLPRAGRALASELAGVNLWLNCDGPLRLPTLYGNVVLLEFWSSGCSNCIRTLPFMVRMHTRYREYGLVVAGIHPIGLDNAYATWNSYGVEFWPTLFVLDRWGAIAHRRVGEGGYAQTERVIKRLLAEPAPDVLDAAAPGSPARRVA